MGEGHKAREGTDGSKIKVVCIYIVRVKFTAY
jgi:hypothetical protein